MKISLRELAYGLDSVSEETSAWLDRRTGTVVVLHRDWDGDEDLEALREEIDTTDHFVRLPDQEDIHEWRIMRDFAQSLSDSELRDELLAAIDGRGAFRMFKDCVARRGVREDWFAFRAAALAAIARTWLEDHGLDYVDDLSSPEPSA